MYTNILEIKSAPFQKMTFACKCWFLVFTVVKTCHENCTLHCWRLRHAHCKV